MTSEQPDKLLEELRMEIKTMIERQMERERPRQVEEAGVETEFLPVYEEKEGKLQFAGAEAQVTVSEVRRREIL